MFLDRYYSHESYLRHFQDRVEVFRVFKRFFPREFRKLGVTPASSLADRNQAYQLLLNLLGEKMPLSFDEYEILADDGDEAMEDEFIEHLPLAPQGRDYDECNPDYLDLCERLILAITQPEFGDEVLRAMVKTIVPTEQISWDALKFICSQQRRPLAYLWEAYAFVYSNTGNSWLDVSPELYWQSEQPEWGVQIVEYLMREWRRAQKIMERIRKFNQWLEADLSRIRKVEAVLRKSSKGLPVRVRTDGRPEPRPLIETLPDFEELEDDDYGFDEED